MDNVLFTIDIDNVVTVWAPINSWEPHILFRRASISMNDSEAVGSIPAHRGSFCILVDSADLTRALETVFNRMNGKDDTTSEQLATIAGIARKGPEICLTLNQHDDSLCVWGIDVSTLSFLANSRKQVDLRNGRPLTAFKILRRVLPNGWVGKLAPYSLFWTFCVGAHGFAGISSPRFLGSN